MNKTFIYAMVFLLSVCVVSAITINSVTVNSSEDVFYSPVSGNNIVHLIANVTSSDATVASVTADFSQIIGVCGGTSDNHVTLTNSGGDLWTGTCDVTTAAAANVYKTGSVLVNAVDNNSVSATSNNIAIATYNLAIPAASDNCYRFDSVTSTNFSQQTNFNGMIITLVIQENGDPACVTSGYAWGAGTWLTVGKLVFTSVNFNNNVTEAQKLVNLSSIAKMRFSSTSTFQNSKVTVDTSQISELGLSTLTVYMNHLYFTSAGSIVSDNSVPANSITWSSNGLDTSLNNSPTSNVSFTSATGFTGFTVIDNVSPIININTSTAGNNTLLNVMINGTGTELSSVTISGSVSGTLSNCSHTQTSELYNCTFNLTQGEGNYNLTVRATDYGNNNATSTSTYYIQNGAPSLILTSPANITYNNSGITLSFTANDGNGIGTCYYNVTGPTFNWTGSATRQITINCTSGTMNVPVYLTSGNYNLTLFVADTLNASNTTSASFTINDTTTPVVTSSSPTPTNLTAVLSVNTNENATCKYDTSDFLFTDPVTTLTDNILQHTANVSLTTNGLTFIVKCQDMSGNMGNTSINLVYTAPTTTPSGGGGSSSSGSGVDTSSTDNTTSNVNPSQSFTMIGSGDQKFIDVSYTKGLPVKSIVINTSSGTSTVIVSVVSPASSSVYSQKVYKYIQVDHPSLDNSNINGAVILFKVDKSWLTSNNLNNSNIVLLRYTDKWAALDTMNISEDNTSVTYQANSPGLSLFAISTKAPDVVVATAAALNANSTNNTNATNSTAKDNLKKPYNPTWTIIIAVLIIIVILFILVQRNERNSPPPIFPEERTVVGKLKRLFK